MPEQSQHKYNCTGKVNTNLNPLSLTAEHHQTQTQGQYIGLLKTDIKIIVPAQCSYQWPTCEEVLCHEAVVLYPAFF